MTACAPPNQQPTDTATSSPTPPREGIEGSRSTRTPAEEAALHLECARATGTLTGVADLSAATSAAGFGGNLARGFAYGAGAAAGVGVVAFVAWRIYQSTQGAPAT